MTPSLQDLQNRLSREVRFRKRYGWFIFEILEVLMADVAQIKQDIAELQSAQAGAVTELETLADQVAQLKDAGADAVTDADLEELHSNLQAVTSGLVSATQQAQGGGAAAPADPGAPDTGGTAPDAGTAPDVGTGTDPGAGGDVPPGAGAPDTAPAASPETPDAAPAAPDDPNQQQGDVQLP